MSQSASIWRMKTMRRLPALLGMLAIVLSCSKLDFMSGWTEFEYDTELAEAYFCGDNPDEGSYQYRLMLLSGRTDGDFNLTYGAKAVLVLNSPEMNSGALPEGLYGEAGSECTMNYGNEDGSILPEASQDSYLELRRLGNDEAQRYPVTSGTVRVKLGQDGCYDIEASFDAGGRRFEFEYEGPLDTYDVCGLQI